MSNFHQLTSDQSNRRQIQLWLFSLCALIFILIIVGGATRLTGSGLSITEWQPIIGAIPPLSDTDWQIAFEKYQQIPQYKEVNLGMTLAEFKSIFWWEWVHRFIGRFIGIAFLIPYLWFTLQNKIAKPLHPKLLLMFALGGAQGVLGWYMVKSGLVERTDVSQYRLAAHLGLAIVIISYIFWVALQLRTNEPRRNISLRARRQSVFLIGLIFLQIIAGAFVAGLKAGKSHNTWPLMDGQWIPKGLDILSPWWKNMFENVMTVQFNHRIIAYLIVAFGAYHLYTLSRENKILPSAILLAIVTLTQITLGIFSLLYVVPINLALAHQGGAVITLAIAIWHYHGLIRHRA